MRTGELLNHNGKLAQYRGARTLPGAPVIETRIAVSELPASQFDELLGRTPTRDGYIQIGHRDVRIMSDDWPVTEVRASVPKPRDGATYTWFWADGSMMSDPRWEKDYYRVCPDCNRQHKPGKCKA